jgi:tetratricopeptide (TPR) repeat protein
VEALALPLGGAGFTPTPDAPHDAEAYRLYLQANELARSYQNLSSARDLYRRCLELDPRFAPAWAQLGRCDRVIAKYFDETDRGTARAEQAFQKALELNPRLALAHKHYANLEADTGHAPRAVVRLLGEADRHGNDPELFAGLVHACRYCGLLEQSIAAHQEARRLDPHIRTSVEQTILMTADIERLLAIERRPLGGGDEVIRVIGLGMAGRYDEARRELRVMREAIQIQAFMVWTDFVLAWLDRDPTEMLRRRRALGDLEIMVDPEAMFQEAWMFSDVGGHERALGLLRRAVAGGYCVVATLERARAFDGLRDDPAFRGLLAEARVGRDQALDAFRTHGGERLLGR